MITVVKFSDPQEFLAELGKDAHLVLRKIVRVTKLIRPTKMAPNIRMISVVATARVAGDILRFERYCGDHWGQGFESTNGPTMDKAERLQVELETACQSIGLEVRAGVIE